MFIPGVLTQQSIQAAAGGYPYVVSTTPRIFTTNTTAHNVTMPASVTSGNLLLISWSNDGAPTITDPGGWTRIRVTAVGTEGQMGLFAKIADGNEGGTNVNFQTSASEQAACIVYEISDWGGTLPTHVVSSTFNQVSPPDPPSLTSGFGAVPTLWFAAVATSSGLSIGTGTPPTNYTGHTSAVSGSSTSSSQIFNARRELTAASENPGAFTFGVSETFLGATIAVKGA